MVGMKASLVAVLSLLGPAMSQYQSFYAGGGWSYPGPLPQFTAANPENDLNNRVGEASTTTQSPDQVISSNVANWPEDRQPFWFVNRDQIQQHLGRPQPIPQGQGTQGQPQSQPGQGTQGQPQNQPGQGTQGQPQNQPGAQTEGPDTQRPLQNQPLPQPQDLPNTRLQVPGTSSRPQLGMQAQDDQSQVQSQQDIDREYLRWLQNQFYASRRQQWSQEFQPDTQTQVTREQLRWTGRPAVKSNTWRQ